MKTPITQTHSEQVKAGMVAKARAGIPTGPVPLGYRKVKKAGVTVVEIDKATALYVQEAFRLAALKRQSLRRILEQLVDLGLTSRQGKSISPPALWRILTNRFYLGEIHYDG